MGPGPRGGAIPPQCPCDKGNVGNREKRGGPPGHGNLGASAAAGERARVHRYGAHCAETMAPTPRSADEACLM